MLNTITDIIQHELEKYGHLCWIKPDYHKAGYPLTLTYTNNGKMLIIAWLRQSDRLSISYALCPINIKETLGHTPKIRDTLHNPQDPTFDIDWIIQELHNWLK